MNINIPFIHSNKAEYFKGRTVVITGAGSGIGQALAAHCASKGANLALADIDGKQLASSINTQSFAGSDIKIYELDVSNRAAVYDFAEEVVKDFGKIDVVINNAGVALSQTVEDMTYEDFEWVMNINFWGVVYGTKAFLPHLKQSDRSYVVNISSIFGLIGVPTQGAYNASKFAVRGFTEALRSELKDSTVTPVCVHPGGIKTNIARRSRFYKGIDGNCDFERAKTDFDRMAKTSPMEAAQTIVQNIETNNIRVLIGTDAYIVDLIQRIMPVKYSQLLLRLVKQSHH